jgi:hypothetical protein
MPKTNAKVCPECGHEFQGNGWDGIDAHWKASHNQIMRYEDAWPLIQSGLYASHTEKSHTRKDFSQTAARIMSE